MQHFFFCCGLWSIFNSVIVLTSWNEIESNIVNCRMSLVVRRVWKKVKIKTQNEKIVETDMIYGNKHIKNNY